MTLPLGGSWEVVVHRVEPYSVHGDRYLRLTVTQVAANDGHGTAGPFGASVRPAVVLRVAAHAMPEVMPQPPFAARLTFLLGQVTSVELRPGRVSPG